MLVASWIVRREWWAGPGRYLLLSGALVVLFLHRSWTDAWQGDFWIYVATVEELKANPGHPGNPLFGGGEPFAFLSPYTWALGLLARGTGLRAFEVLLVQGFFNLAFLLGALYAFVATWLGRPAAAFYALLFVLFLWGPEPWLFSGFFHLRSLAFVLPYPSTFAAALALSALAAFRWTVGRGSWAWAGPMVAVAAFLWVVHPVNALFLCLGLLACSLETRRARGHWLALGLVFAAGFSLALLWPLFPVRELWFGQIGHVHQGNDAMYDGPLSRIAPALLGVPVLFWRLRRNARDPVALLALALGLLVAWGGLSGASTYGRLIAHAVLLLHVVLADAVARLEDAVSERPSGAVLRHLFAPAAAALLLAFGWSGAVRPTLQEAWRGDPLWLAFLGHHVGRQDVVLTDLDNCWHVPAFAGKVVAYPMLLPFVPDEAERTQAVARFFERGVSTDERRDILRRYGVSYLLLPAGAGGKDRAPVDDLRPFGRLVFSNPDYELRRVEPADRR